MSKGNENLYGELFAGCSPIVTPLLLMVKEESFDHHLHLVESVD